MKLRKILPLIAVLLLVLIAIPMMVVSASAEEATPSEGLTYAFSDSTKTAYRVTGIGSFTGTELVIPETYNGLPVVAIGKDAFRGNTKITSVYIPDSVTTGGHAAFMECSNLKSVRLSPNMEFITTYMFSKTGLTEVVIPEGAVTVGGSAFRECRSMTSITFSSTVKSINANAFRTCKALTALVIPDNVTFIDHAAFNGCSQLKTAVISKNVENLPGYMFTNCGNLRSVTIQEGTKTIGNYAMSECPFLKDVTLPSTLTRIGTNVFRPAASQVSRLATIQIPDGVTYIGNFAFYKAPLTEIYIPASVTEIGNNAFSGCNSLAAVYYGGASETEWNAINFNSNALLLKVTRYYYAEENPQAEGFWHYVNGKPAVWESAPAEFTVTFNANGQGTAPAAQTVVAGATATKPADPTATGYTFGGWYTDAACTKAYDFAAEVTADVTLYAKWTVKTYTVTFDANGQGTAPAAQTVVYGATATKPADLVAAGYVFGGWYTDAACTNAYAFGEVTADVTVYAKWTATNYTLSADGTYYTVTGFGIELTGADVKVPATFNGLPVKAIAAGALADASINTVVVPASVTSVASGAFAADTVVYFEGAADAWTGDAANVFFYSASEPLTFDTHWHYVDGEIVIWGVPDDVVVGGDPDDGDLEMPEIGI